MGWKVFDGAPSKGRISQLSQLSTLSLAGAVDVGWRRMLPDLPEDLRRVLRKASALERAYLVGGCVRDRLLGLPVKDFDVEVYGVDLDELVTALRPFGRTDQVGRSFGVVKLTTRPGRTYDFTLPRRDSKIASGHRGFEVKVDPGIDPEEAASRRDFTVNALMQDAVTGEILDFFGGRSDLEHRILRHTGPAFVEDPLRVLRGMQFASRYDLEPAEETVGLCRSITGAFDELARERVWEEWWKWATCSVRPSRGLLFLEASGWLRHFPELAVLRETPQDPAWHPEGDVFIHTAHCLDALVPLPEWQAADAETRAVLSFAVLTHDLGKAVTTERVERDGKERIISPGHDEAGVPLAVRFLDRLNAPGVYVKRVPPLVQCHMAHMNPATPRGVRRLARRLEPETIDHLAVVVTADASGRPPQPPGMPENFQAWLDLALDLKVQDTAPQPLLMGRHLQACGMKPGRRFGEILKAAFEAQLDGDFTEMDGAWEWLKAAYGIQAAEENPRQGVEEGN